MIDFDSALTAFGTLLIRCLGTRAAQEGRIVRDVYGRLSFVTAHPTDAAWNAIRQQAGEVLGAYGEPRGQLLLSLSDDEDGFRALAAEPSIPVRLADQPDLRLLDRRLAGDDWLMQPVPLASNPRRLIFHSIKGGVGRSTALAVTAADLAAHGYNTLVVDLDLEAPGLGTMLLPSDRLPKYGVVDWLAAIAAGADGDSVITDMVGTSPYTSARAIVDVVPAAGREPGAYLSKLARAYTPGSARAPYLGFRFSKKADALVTGLSSRNRYDAVLVDARAGLHETSGGLVLGLGAKTLLFGVHSSQTLDDFRLLFDALAQAFDPTASGEDLRYAFKMVHAKAPRDERERRPFREQCWDLWSRYLYDDADPTLELSKDTFVFDLNDESAPHYPLEIIGDDSYARFDPRTETYPLSATAYEPLFGNLLAGARTMLELP